MVFLNSMQKRIYSNLVKKKNFVKNYQKCLVQIVNVRDE